MAYDMTLTYPAHLPSPHACHGGQPHFPEIAKPGAILSVILSLIPGMFFPPLSLPNAR
jgi:hypothetical protein